MRLNKFLAHAGVASRRAADELIATGRVRVNGRVVRAMGVQIDPERDQITVDGKPVHLNRAAFIYLLLNKPAGVITSRKDPEGRRTLYDLIPRRYHHLHPVGRLDFQSEGLVLLTDDGDLTQRLTHPSHRHEKEYWVQVAGQVPDVTLHKLRKGVPLEDGLARARVRYLGKIPPEQRFWIQPDSKHTWMVFILHEGRNRQIRRMCQAVGLRVRRLVRVRIDSIHIGDLKPGQWRLATKRQLKAIRAIKAGGK
ncbi:MAG TPA: rRNA pseudouridine synthase [Anaerolineae bacterium]|nr:rRNA pseudouridine synthase [Caldilineae bacterium]HID35674.1 rRNA pseudouridine synthase [Anaerolineae bacterium]HIQ12385.1 rRNA pseudouridine synthase [Caldilineales bacterium]